MAFEKVLDQSIILFLLIMIGFVSRRRNIITDDMIKGFTELVLKITLPLFIIVSMDNEFSKDKIVFSGLIVFISVFTYLFKIVLANVITKFLNPKDLQRGVYKFLIIFSNSGFMGYPISYAIYGEDGVFYVAMLNISYNVLVWTLGVRLLDKDSVEENSLKSLLLNPGIFSVLIGMIFFITPLSIPNILNEPMAMVGGMTTPLAMIVVGGILGGTKVGDSFKNKSLLVTSLVRLVVVPSFILLVLMPIGLPKIVLGITVIVDAMPAAANTAIFARKYDSDYSLASQGVFLSTLINIVTTPLILYMFIRLVGM